MHKKSSELVYNIEKKLKKKLNLHKIEKPYSPNIRNL